LTALSIGAVIFDLDGTLADTIGDLATAVNAVLAAHNFPLHPFSAYKTIGGKRLLLAHKARAPGGAAEDDRFFDTLLIEASSTYARESLNTQTLSRHSGASFCASREERSLRPSVQQAR